MTFWADVPAVVARDGTLISPVIPAPPPVDQAAVWPSVNEVAELSATRTVDAAGVEQDTFTATTRPTSTEVEALIATAVADVLSQLPPNVDPVWYPAISRAAALRAAFTLEASFYRESMTNVGPGAEYGRRFAADLTALQGLIPRATFVA